jgi:hypothetical protein
MRFVIDKPFAIRNTVAMSTATQHAAPSPLRLLIEERLDTPLAELVTKERNAGRSWAAVARIIHADTKVPVTAQSLRNWFGPADSGRRVA